MDVKVKEIRLTKCPPERGGGFWVVVKGKRGDESVVSFVHADEPSEALRVAIEKLDNGSARWREDKPPVGFIEKVEKTENL